MSEQTHQVSAEIAEVEGSLVIIARAVSARVPCDRMELTPKFRKLVVPISTIAADTMHENNGWTNPVMVNGDSRRARNVIGHEICQRNILLEGPSAAGMLPGIPFSR